MHKKDLKVRVGISIGDINGIGPEIILKTFSDNRMFDFCTPVVFGSTKILSYYRKALNLPTQFYGIGHLGQMAPKRLNVLNMWREVINIEMGKPDPEIGRYAVESFKRAVEALQQGEIDVLVTAPINKHTVQSDDFEFPGHTDYLAQVSGSTALMFMISDELKVSLVTDHLPLRHVSTQITKDKIQEKIRLTHESLLRDFGIEKPKIAVLALNPHAGDKGLIGREDDEIVAPAIRELYENEDIWAFGPYAADGFFGSQAYKNYDAVVAMYHDQGLIPFKLLSFGHGVNFTAGLDFVRTSPDHGTAYEITGKGIADESSFRQAVYEAVDIFRRRKEYDEWRENRLPVKSSEPKTVKTSSREEQNSKEA